MIIQSIKHLKQIENRKENQRNSQEIIQLDDGKNIKLGEFSE